MIHQSAPNSFGNRPFGHYNAGMKKSISAPGKHYRKGLSLVELVRMCSNDETVKAWFMDTRWPDGVACHQSGRMIVK